LVDVYDETGETVALATILTMVKKLKDEWGILYSSKGWLHFLFLIWSDLYIKKATLFSVNGFCY
jgi:hypothetical protein